MNRALDRALADPDRFMCKAYPDNGAARVALALLEHPELGREMLNGLGWWSDAPGLARSDDQVA